jgi:exodeoxyribonuclease III
VRREVAVVPYPPFNRFAHGFSHIFGGGYAAGYYSYKWAEVLSADAFSLFEEHGVSTRRDRARFRECILEVGGSVDRWRHSSPSAAGRRSRPPAAPRRHQRRDGPRPEAHARRQLERQFPEGAPAAGARLAGGEPPDVLGLQETKLVDEAFPLDAIREAGYELSFSGQPTYNGVALLSRAPQGDVITGLDGLEDPQRRVLGATIGGCASEPVRAERPGGRQRQVRLQAGWLESLRAHLAAELARHPRMVVMGDFNIAPEDRDVHDPAEWAGKVLCSEPERAALGGFSSSASSTRSGCSSSRRAFSWWDYRAAGFRRNRGLRIDLVLASQELAGPAPAPGWTSSRVATSGPPITPRVAVFRARRAALAGPGGFPLACDQGHRTRAAGVAGARKASHRLHPWKLQRHEGPRADAPRPAQRPRRHQHRARHPLGARLGDGTRRLTKLYPGMPLRVLRQAFEDFDRCSAAACPATSAATPSITTSSTRST